MSLIRLLHGVRIGNADIALGLTGQTTDGHTGIVAADAQTALDRILGTSASLTPGRINTDRDIIDLRLDASLRPLRFRAGYYSYVTGTGTGLINAPDPGGTIGLSQFSSDLTYDARLSSNWDLTAQASYFETFNEAGTERHRLDRDARYVDGLAPQADCDEVESFGQTRARAQFVAGNDSVACSPIASGKRPDPTIQYLDYTRSPRVPRSFDREHGLPGRDLAQARRGRTEIVPVELLEREGTLTVREDE